ncbi:MAG TPA: alcohol dehydrogenase catalytic domain-containing protein, partial [Streptosporangiaceae bacterium]|nr:alcohol dehydrogenase catalytic domain-containing protein [Streptosporangiaceae bacterium]
VEATGPAVHRVGRGDRVVLPAHIYCGVCFNCSRGYSAACLRVHPGHAGGAYAMPGMGPFRGSQAELVRVPFADANCVVLPGESGDEHEDDFVLLADAWVTGWHATELAGVRPADTVAVFGAGTVGLLAAYSARLRGASEVYSVDLVDARLGKAGEMGFVPVDARRGDPVEQIRELARARRGAGPPGEEEMSGVMAGIDAVGFQARDRDHPDREDPRQVISDLARLVNPTGRVGIAGVFTAADAAPAADGGHADGSLHVPWATLFDKGVTVGFGRTHDRRYTAHLRDLIISGRARPSQIVTHHASLDQAPDMYDRFDRRVDGIVKVVFNH